MVKRKRIRIDSNTRRDLYDKFSDYTLDLSKLVFGGVILAGLMKQEIDYAFLAICALAAVTAFVGLGMYLIKVSNRK